MCATLASATLPRKCSHHGAPQIKPFGGVGGWHSKTPAQLHRKGNTHNIFPPNLTRKTFPVPR